MIKFWASWLAVVEVDYLPDDVEKLVYLPDHVVKLTNLANPVVKLVYLPDPVLQLACMCSGCGGVTVTEVRGGRPQPGQGKKDGEWDRLTYIPKKVFKSLL